MGLYQDALELVDGGISTNLRDGSGNNISSTGGSLDVNVTNSISIGSDDQSAFAYGTSLFQAVGGVYNDTGATLTSGQSGAFRLTAERGMHINLRNASGAELGAANVSGLFVRPGDGTNAQAYSAAGESYSSIRQGGNVANVTASNELKVLDTNAGSILALMKPATPGLTQVVLSTSSQTALASNAARKGASFVNDSNKIVYLAFGATATTSAYTVKMQPNSYYELMSNRVYTGVISVIGAAGVSGSLVVTELT